jgi:adenine deaminase
VAGRLTAPVRGGLIGPLPEGYCYISVTGRHGQGRPPFVGVLKGLGIRSGAHGTTVAHDSHNMVIAGVTPADMLLVAKTLVAQGGGFALANDGAVRATVALPLAGLMTPEPVEAVAPRVEAYNERAAALGILAGTRSPILSLAGIALPVVPEVKITDLGLVHVNSQRVIPLFPAA